MAKPWCAGSWERVAHHDWGCGVCPVCGCAVGLMHGLAPRHYDRTLPLTTEGIRRKVRVAGAGL